MNFKIFLFFPDKIRYHFSKMKHLKHLFWVTPLIIFLGIFLWCLNYSYPVLGHDFVEWYPHLLAGKWHFLRQGIAPFWYIVHLCGGIPEYGNPQDMYYSLPQLLFLFTDFWSSVQISIIVAMLLGYLGWYLSGRDILKLSSAWGHVFALIILAQGFYFVHVVVGHLVFHTMPMIGLLVWLFYSRQNYSLKQYILKTALFGLITTYMMYSGGYYVVLFALFALGLFLPLDLIINSSDLKKRSLTIGLRTLCFGTATLAINASRLTAIYYFMRFFPREMPFDRLEGSALAYIFKTFWVFPHTVSLFQPYGFPDWAALHEYSRGISHIVLLGLIIGLPLLWLKKELIKQYWKRFLALIIYSIFFLIILIQVTRGYGWLVTPLEPLPVARSLHAMLRILYVFAFFLSGLAVWNIAKATDNFSLKTNNTLALICSFLTIISFAVVTIPLVKNPNLLRFFPYDQILHLEKNSGDFLKLSVSKVVDWKSKGQYDLPHLFEGSTGVKCYEPVFWRNQTRNDTLVAEGPVDQVINDHYNLYKAACLQYPEVNNCEFAAKIPLDEREDLEKFRHGEKTSWKLPFFQHLTNWISLITFIFFVLISTIFGFSNIKKIS